MKTAAMRGEHEETLTDGGGGMRGAFGIGKVVDGGGERRLRPVRTASGERDGGRGGF